MLTQVAYLFFWTRFHAMLLSDWYYILMHKTNLVLHRVSMEHDGFDMMSNHRRRVWFGSSAPLRLCGFCTTYILLRWERWYLAPKESLLLIWLWIMQGFIWCQTMWQSSVLYVCCCTVLYGLWWTKAVLTVWSDGFLYKVALPELEITPSMYFSMYNLVA